MVECKFNFSGATNVEMTFDYHMYGTNVVSLSVDIHDGTTWYTNVWIKNGQQHASSAAPWSNAVVDLSAYAGSPDADQFSNEIEWALNTNPLVSDSPSLILANNGSNFTVTYSRRDVLITGIDVHAAWNDSLGSTVWHLNGDGMTEVSLGWNGEIQTLQAQRKNPCPKACFRIPRTPHRRRRMNPQYSISNLQSPMSQTVPIEHNDPTNAKILSISEDLIAGFQQQPFHLIAEQSGVPLETVLERIRAMQEAGIIRRVRQTLLSTKLAHGALVAWKVPEEKLNDAFDFMSKNDPFSGHVVIRSTDTDVSGSGYRLWTTLKVPVGESLDFHATALLRLTGATEYLLMPANGVFALGVGHTRRKTLEPGDKTDEPAVMMTTTAVDLTPVEWKVLLALKEELTLDEIRENPWNDRADLAGVSLDRFCEVAETLNSKKVIGRFSTFLEHVKPSSTGERVTRFNGLFHWAVPKGREIEAGGEVGRHFCMTHAYWREGGPQFGDVNVMGVVHGTEKDRVLEHKAAIDRHLESVGIPVSYTNVFWGGRSEIKPSEISPKVYAEWHAQHAG